MTESFNLHNPGNHSHSSTEHNRIQVSGLAKRFNREWIFRNFNFAFQGGKKYAITGPNGSGKSTLLQVLWGQLPATQGAVSYTVNQQLIPTEDFYKEISIAAPYLDVIEEFTLHELIRFHFSLRKIRPDLQKADLLQLMELMGLKYAQRKPIGNFSSGMRQRLKLGLALFTHANFIFLDEPFTNLDQPSIAWYKQQLLQVGQSTVIIASNNPEEYRETDYIIEIQNFK